MQKKQNIRSVIIGEEFDRRKVLTDQDKVEIVAWFAQGESIRAIAKRFSVSRRTIDFTVHPEKRARHTELQRARHKARKLTPEERDRNNLSSARSRAYKRSLIEQGLIGGENAPKPRKQHQELAPTYSPKRVRQVVEDKPTIEPPKRISPSFRD